MSNTGEFVDLLNKEMDSLVDDYAKRRIADLEAKLAVYEKELMDNEKCFTEKDVESLIKDREETIKFLKQQLAEKDAEIRVAYSFRKQKCDNLQKALTEKDEQLQQAIEMINNPDTLFYQQQELIDNLKVQLAEKQKKKEDFKTMYFNKCLDYEHLHEKFDDKCAEFELKEYDYKQTIFEKDQDKISFCIEKLTDIRSFVSDATEIKEPDYTKVCNYIDNQIASLKKGVE